MERGGEEKRKGREKKERKRRAEKARTGMIERSERWNTTRVGRGEERRRQKRKERGDRGSPDRCDIRAKIGRTAYANATVWPWWNAVKTDGANRREKASPSR